MIINTLLIDINARDYIDEKGIGTSVSTCFISASIYCNSNVIFIWRDRVTHCNVIKDVYYFCSQFLISYQVVRFEYLIITPKGIFLKGTSPGNKLKHFNCL